MAHSFQLWALCMAGLELHKISHPLAVLVLNLHQPSPSKSYWSQYSLSKVGFLMRSDINVLLRMYGM